MASFVRQTIGVGIVFATKMSPLYFGATLTRPSLEHKYVGGKFRKTLSATVNEICRTLNFILILAH